MKWFPESGKKELFIRPDFFVVFILDGFPFTKNDLAAQKKEEWDLVTQEVHKKEKTRTQSMFRDTC